MYFYWNPNFYQIRNFQISEQSRSGDHDVLRSMEHRVEGVQAQIWDRRQSVQALFWGKVFKILKLIKNAKIQYFF